MMAVPPVHHACNHPTYNHHRPNILVYSWWWWWRLWWTTTHATIIEIIFFSFLRSLFRRLHLVDVVLHKNIAKSITKPGSTLMNVDGTGTSVFFEKIWFLLKYFFCMYRSLNKKYEVHVYHLKYEKQTITTMIMIIWLSSPQDKCRKKILKSILKNPNGLHISYFRTIEQTWQTKGLFHMCKILVIISKK